MRGNHLTTLYGMPVRKIGLRETVVRAAEHKGLSLAEICRRRGIARGTMYRNFQSKAPSERVLTDYYWALFVWDKAEEVLLAHGQPSQTERLG